jgi:spore germination protein GerM
VHYAQAQGDWMTTNFVPFSSTLTFSTPTTPTGILVLQKDNPSGLPENDAEIRIPVRFAETTANNTQTRTVKLYFYNENLDKDASGNVLCSEKGLVAVNRTIPRTNTPIQDAVRELLKGPTQAEKTSAQGNSVPQSEFPLSGVALNSASLTGGVLTLAFSDPQNKTSGGSCRVQVLREQIEATGSQFGGVNSVRFQPSGVFQP